MLQILNGRYCVYISYKKEYYQMRKTVDDPSALTLAQAMEIVNSQESKPKRKKK